MGVPSNDAGVLQGTLQVLQGMAVPKHQNQQPKDKPPSNSHLGHPSTKIPFPESADTIALYKGEIAVTQCASAVGTCTFLTYLLQRRATSLL